VAFFAACSAVVFDFAAAAVAISAAFSCDLRLSISYVASVSWSELL
jgi:hypothetical protein